MATATTTNDQITETNSEQEESSVMGSEWDLRDIPAT